MSATFEVGLRIRLVPKTPGKLVRDAVELVTMHERFGPRERRTIGDVIRRGIWRNFQTESWGGGQPWVRLRPRTIQERRELGFAGEHPILKRTGSLRDSIIIPTHPLHDEQWGTFAGATVVVIRSEDERIPTLAGGSPWENIPPRPIFLLGPRELSAIGDIIEWVLQKKARSEGF